MVDTAVTTDLQALADAPFELLVAMQARLGRRAGGSDGAQAAATWSGLTFTVGGQCFVAPQADVAELLDLPQTTRVPCSQRWMLGVTSLRGTLLPIADLAMLLGRQQTVLSRDSRVLVLNDARIPLGFLVDRVAGLHRFTPADQRHELLDAHAATPVDNCVLGGLVGNGQFWKVLALRKLARDPLLQDAGV